MASGHQEMNKNHIYKQNLISGRLSNFYCQFTGMLKSLTLMCTEQGTSLVQSQWKPVQGYVTEFRCL